MFLQFELWKECRNNCSFCYNKGIPFRRNKIKSMQFVKEKLLSTEADKYDKIGFIMGEAFDGQLKTKEEQDLFYELIKITIDKLKDNKINQVYITASLIYKNIDNWFYFCNYLNKHKVLDKFLICTSYDIEGRFNTIKLALWNDTISKTKKFFPDIKLHVEMILTENFLQAVLNKKFDIKAFENKYDCKIDYIVPFLGYGNIYKTKKEMQEKIPNFFPKRKTLYAFLQYVYNNGIFGINDLYLFLNINLHSDKLYFSLDDETFIEKENRHVNENKKYYSENIIGGYIDSDIHPRKDVEMFINEIGG